MDFFSRRRLGISLALLFGLSAIAMAVDAFPPLVNWAAPATYTPPRSAGAHALSDITLPQPLIFINPCRQFDIRPGVLADNTPLAITLTGAPCGIPTSATAVSVNITVFSIVAGANGVFKVDTVSPPVVAWINYPPTETQRGNAGIVPLNASHQIIVEVNQGGGSIQLVVDVNGYVSSIPGNLGDSFQLVNNSSFASIAGGNDSTAGTAIGVLGEMFSTSPAGSSAGVKGINSGTASAGIGVWGTQAGSGLGVVGQALGSTGSGAGVLGEAFSISDNAEGVLGVSFGTTGKNFGVTGATSSASNSAAGVRGIDSTGALTNSFWSSSGLLGEGENGILGYTSAGGGIAVIGQGLTTAGAAVVTGFLGDEFLANHGVWAFLGDIGCSSCTKAFVDPHPTDASKEIRFVSLEGNEAGTYFRGTAETVGREFVIQVPEDFRLVTDTDPASLTVQLTPVGEPATMYVVSEDLNQIVVHSSKDVKFHYLVNGVRASFKDIKTIVDATDFVPQTRDGRMPDGWADLTKQRLIANGTYNKDGTINMDTAERLGWAEKWREAEKRAATAAEAHKAAADAGRSPQ